MAEILLSTFNARYTHPALGLRYLQANLGALRERSKLLEFDVHTDPSAAADALLAENPSVVGLGVYIWNLTPLTRLVDRLKDLRPDLRVVLGGPEVSYRMEELPVVQRADFVLAGEADLAFAELCAALCAGQRPTAKILRVPRPELDRVALPYGLYSQEDIAHRLIYVETTRGCPFACQYCLSSVEPGVRRFPLPAVLAEIQNLLERGARRFKFVDRSFNVDVERACAVLAFFRERLRDGLSLHFEMVPDRFPPRLREAIRAFPPGMLRLEIGVQTYSADVAGRVGRRADFDQTDANLRFLREETGALLHADLIAGLPGETLAQFAAGFDRLLALAPHEIQVGVLKRLRGTNLDRHSEAWGMVYAPEPPYEVLETRTLPRQDLDRIKRFAYYWERIVNRGRFRESAPWIWKSAPSPFYAFLRFSDWLFARVGRAHSLSLDELALHLFHFLTLELRHDVVAVAEAMRRDWLRDGRRRPLPGFLRRAWLPRPRA